MSNLSSIQILGAVGLVILAISFLIFAIEKACDLARKLFHKKQ